MNAQHRLQRPGPADQYKSDIVDNPYRFGLIGSGWRSQFFCRLAQQDPEHFTVTGIVTRTAERGAEVEANCRTPAFRTVSGLLATEPEFVVVCVPSEQAPDAVAACIEERCRVLAETPPAPDRDSLRQLWNRVGHSELVAVAEQYLMMPGHACRLSLVREGIIGEVTSVQTCSTHLYHAVSMIRGFLGTGFDSVTITGQKFVAPLADPLTPAGWTGSIKPEDRETTVALLDFGRTVSAVYEFTDNQWWNPLRTPHVLIRGTQGEIHDNTVVRMVDPTTPVTSTLDRRRPGVGLNLEGVDLQHISFDGRVMYRNPFLGARFSEDDLAVAHLLARTGAWCRDEGPQPYSLADGCHDQAIAIGIEQAASRGERVLTEVEPWTPPATS